MARTRRTYTPEFKATRAVIIDYIEIFYNSQRRHSSLGYVSPAEYERKNP